MPSRKNPCSNIITCTAETLESRQTFNFKTYDVTVHMHISYRRFPFYNIIISRTIYVIINASRFLVFYNTFTYLPTRVRIIIRKKLKCERIFFQTDHQTVTCSLFPFKFYDHIWFFHLDIIPGDIRVNNIIVMSSSSSSKMTFPAWR